MMIDHLEKPDQGASYVRSDSALKDYSAGGRCTAAYLDERRCQNFMPGGTARELCARRCGYSNRCMPVDPVDKAVELNEGKG